MFERKAKRKKQEQSSSGPAKILYLCDRRRCDNCSEDCRLTSDIRHAKSFKKHGAAFYEDENQQTEREEAIQRLKANRNAMYFPETIEALDMAIEALQQEEHLVGLEAKAVEVIKSERHGEWIKEDEYGDLWVCDQCGFASEHKDNYCPNCGAKMSKGGGNECR